MLTSIWKLLGRARSDTRGLEMPRNLKKWGEIRDAKKVATLGDL